MKVAAFAIAYLLSSPLMAQYFESNIEYFENTNQKPKSKVLTKTKGESKTSKFDWDKHMDPENEEFFKEGNHVPPETFMEAVRRPTDENINNYLNYLSKRAKLFAKFNEKLKEVSASKGVAPQRLPKAPQIEVDDQFIKNYKLLFFFDANCPFCKRMYEDINALAHMGLIVEAVRVDNTETPVTGLMLPYKRLDKKELLALEIDSVPYLKIINHKEKKIKNLKGYKSLNEILNVLKKGAI